MSFEIQPLGDRVIVERKEEEQKSLGGIVIPDSAKEKPIEGLIVAIGPGKPLENGELLAMPVKVGDRVLFGKYAGTEIKHNGKEYMVMRADDLIGIIKG